MLVAAAAYTEATGVDATDAATLEAIDLAQDTLNTAVQAWLARGRPDAAREDLAPMAREVVAACTRAWTTQGEATALDDLALTLTRWESLGFPGLPVAEEA